MTATGILKMSHYFIARHRKCENYFNTYISVYWYKCIHILMHICKCWYSFVCVYARCLTHWGQVTHICVIELVILGSDNGLSPGRRKAIIWTNAGILLIGPLGANFSENLIAMLTFSFTKMRLKVSSAKWRPFCLGLNVLNIPVSARVHFCPLKPGKIYMR